MPPAPTTTNQDTVSTLCIRQEIAIAAPIEIAWDAILHQMGPGGEMPDGTPFPFKLEAWPGGRWYRDLGEAGGYKQGHLWGHVQVIKAPFLLELNGPMPMSFPAVNFLQYRLKPEANGTRLQLAHRAMGILPQELFDGMPEGWQHGVNRIKLVAEQKAKSRD